MKDLLLGLALLSAPAVVLVVYGSRGPGGEGLGPSRPVARIEEGRIAFAENCAACHGRLARGTERGPSLVTPEFHAISDAELRRRVRRCRASCAARGMPPFPDLPDRDLDQIITFLREMQRLEAAR